MIPLRAFTAFGVNVKPETKSPIGYFGTGLKYAIAILIRNGCKVTMHRDGWEYEFKGRSSDFRDKEFTFIDLVRKKGLFSRTTELPFTTDLGKTWELWQAFRELYANTLDENGVTELEDTTTPLDTKLKLSKGQTLIFVEGEKYVDCFHRKDEIFLPDALRERAPGDAQVQRFERPSKFVYYRGMRIHELREPSMYTYNILNGIDLTEDRTAKYSFQIDQIIASFVKSQTDKLFIRKVLRAPKGNFEHRMSYTYSYNDPTKEFLDTAQELGNDAVSQDVRDMVATYRPEEKELPKLDLGSRLKAIIGAIEDGKFDLLQELIEQDRDEFLKFLKNVGAYWDKYVPQRSSEIVDDDIPF